MRKLKLQTQMAVDGFVAGPNGELDWMNFNWGKDIMDYVNDLTDSSGTILLGRKMAEGFITQWSNVVSNPDDPTYTFGKKMIDIPKIVFSRTLNKSSWNNTIVVNGELVEEIDKPKKQMCNDLIVYGGASFLSSFIGGNLIDEYNLF
jgi:dihydrofolate reductase